MDISTQRKNARKFIEEWKDRGREKQDSQSFWLSLLHNILGVENPEKMIRFEEKVKLTHDSFIDAYIDQTHTMIEQKGANKDLDKAIKQSDGSLLTPYQQAFRYSIALPYSKRPRWIVTCNFKEFRVYDMEHPNSEPTRIELKDLAKDFYQLEFLIDKTDEHLEKEKQVSLDAGELVGKIYDELLKQYKDPSNPHSQKSINQLCVRIVFCLYAEDSGIFGRKKIFHDYLKQYDAQHTRLALVRLFKVLDTKIEERDPYLANDDPMLADFPYVNGGMFSDEDIEIPSFTDELRELLLNNASNDFDWSDISPTIFGAVFESTLNPETRRQGGMHYTSVENIHKVIDPLFLDKLKDKLFSIKQYKQEKRRQDKAKEFQKELAKLTFFDPACGSGNFLTETYLQLRRLENEALKLIYPNPQLDTEDVIKVSIQQFYGVEINDFAVSVAKTALWIAESQMWEETKDIFFADWDFLPLKTYTHIHEGNALTMDWNTILPNHSCNYIMGNPPFVGYKQQNAKQKEDLRSLNIKTKAIDYVAGWYYKACEYMKTTSIKTAFVSTNSICQGEQIVGVWKPLIRKFNLNILFAYTSFPWTSEAQNKAQVWVIIVGFQLGRASQAKTLYSNGLVKRVDHINQYLIPYKDIFVFPSRKPLISSVTPMTYGNEPREGNFLIMSCEEADKIGTEYPLLKRYIHDYVSAKDYITNKFRKCLWLVNASPQVLRSNKWIKDRLSHVKEYREKSKQKTAHAMASQPYLFASIRQPKTNYLLFPIVSSASRRYIPIGYVDKEVIASNACFTVANASLFTFGVLASNLHMAWTRIVAGRLGIGLRYSNTLVYNTFPFPEVTNEQKKNIEKTAQEILDARALYPDSSLADLYDPLTMPKELLKAHQDNDRAVMQAYGLSVKDTTESDAVAHLFKMYEKLTKNEK